MPSLSVTTPSGCNLTVERLSAAEAAVRAIAANNSQMLSHHYGTSREDVEALAELAHMKWFELGRKA